MEAIGRNEGGGRVRAPCGAFARGTLGDVAVAQRILTERSATRAFSQLHGTSTRVIIERLSRSTRLIAEPEKLETSPSLVHSDLAPSAYPCSERHFFRALPAMFAVAAPIGSVRAAARGASRVRRPSLVRAAAKGKKDVDWDAKTKELTAERVLEQCMEAMADGDEDRLEACLLELETPEETKEVAAAASANTDDEFWKKKLAEIAAARVLDNCMSAVMMGDSDEIEACMLDAENDTLLGEDFTTAEDGSKTFKF